MESDRWYKKLLFTFKIFTIVFFTLNLKYICKQDMARLRLVQHHATLCHRRLAPHSIPLPPPGLSEPEPPKQLLL